jgi:pimeloyl-ACP methyl ester carboxylesterase
VGGQAAAGGHQRAGLNEPPPGEPDESSTRWVASTDGVRLAVHDLGGDGPPALLCHATGFHARVWQPVADRLPLRCYALDFRGHGDSELPDDVVIEWRGFAHDVLAVVDALGLDRPVAVGHSKGGAALLLAEQERPGTFAALYCYEPIVFPPVPGSARAAANPLADGARRRRSRFASYQEAFDNYASKPPLDVLDPDALWAYVRHGFRQQADGSVTIKCRPDIEAATFETGVDHDGFARLGELRCPVIVARGADHEFGPAAIAPAVAAALPHGRLEDHPDLGHFGPLEDPAAIADAVAAAFA